ncbi:MAG: ABC transporter ATP-binding protein [Peptococcaceae bacterium]|jgi:ABC-type lipoprotein export system ATPase subunit|nr:ABC transporter ATP-binding protein [Peptococcaceae bacterium]
MEIVLRDVSHHFIDGGRTLTLFERFSTVIPEQATTIIYGPSGSGKSTLISIIGGLLKPVRGRVIMDGKSYYEMSERDRDMFRAQKIGFIFQMFYLIPDMDVLSNVMLSMHELSASRKVKQDRAVKLLAQVGLLDRINSNPLDLSGGEQQRVAIARALANEGSVIIADEPTGNLDESTANAIMRMLCELKREGKTVIIVTHNQSYKRFADNLIEYSR